MEGTIDLRLVITVSTLLVSVVAASAIARHQIKELLSIVQSIRKELSVLDLRVDRAEMASASLQQRTEMLARMSSPERLEVSHRETADLIARVAAMADDVRSLKQMHNNNGMHPVVPTTRLT